jgi:hypothetical protein
VVAHERDEQGVCDLLGADGLIYQTAWSSATIHNHS